MAKLSWKNHIKRAVATGQFSRTAKDRVASWQTCAVGERFAEVGVVEDEEISNMLWRGDSVEMDDLRILGWEFSRAVESDSISRAKRIFRSIQMISFEVTR